MYARTIRVVAALAVTLALSDYTYAQGTITWGAAPSAKDMVLDRSICSEEECYLYNYSFGTPSFILARVDEALVETARTEVMLTVGSSELVWCDFQVVGDKLVVFGYRDNKETKSHQLLAKSFDRVTLSSTEDWRVVADVDGSPESTVQPFRVHLSPAQRKVLIFCRLRERKDLGEQMSMHAIDDDLRPVWNTVGSVPAEHFKLHEQCLIGEDGSAFLLYPWNGTKEDAQEYKRSLKPYGGYCLFRFGQGGARDSVLFRNRDHFLLNMRVSQGERGDELCAAAFYSMGSKLLCRGAIVFDLDPATMKETHQQSLEFTDEFLKRWLSEDEAKRNRTGSSKWFKGKFHGLAYSVCDMHRNHDGSVTLIAEQTSASPVLGASQRASEHAAPPIMYTSMDVAVIRIDTDPERSWVAGIPKRQYYASTLSCYAMEEGVAVLYTDRRANLEAAPGSELKYLGAKSVYESFEKPDEVTMIAWVSPDGSISKSEFKLPDDTKYDVYPYRFEPFGKGRMLVDVFQNKSVRYGVLQF